MRSKTQDDEEVPNPVRVPARRSILGPHLTCHAFTGDFIFLSHACFIFLSHACRVLSADGSPLALRARPA
eukprot:SAG22_NODE_20794_length_262_cov_1.386503_1_plen_69_part_10